MKELLETLTDEQKFIILKEYLTKQINDNLIMDKTYLYGGTKLTPFGEKLVKGLSDQIEKSAVEAISKSEVVNQYIKDSVEKVQKNIEIIISQAITKYIIDNLFNNKQEIGTQIDNQVFQIINNLRN